MTLKTEMQNDADILIDDDDFGSLGDYWKKASDTTVEQISVEAVYFTDETEFEMEGQWAAKRGNFQIKRADISAPARGDTFTNSDGEVFMILKPIKSDSVFVLVEGIEKQRQTIGDIKQK